MTGIILRGNKVIHKIDIDKESDTLVLVGYNGIIYYSTGPHLKDAMWMSDVKLSEEKIKAVKKYLFK